MSDRKRAFVLLDDFRTILRSDAEPQEIVDALAEMVTGIERLTVDEDVLAIASGMVEETSMRVSLILEANMSDERMIQNKQLVASIKVIERFADEFLQKARGGMFNRHEIKEALDRRAEFRQRMEDQGLW